MGKETAEEWTEEMRGMGGRGSNKQSQEGRELTDARRGHGGTEAERVEGSLECRAGGHTAR